jgi:hypothetical protein
MPIKRNDIFRNDQFDMTYKILEFLPGDRVKVEYTRNGVVEVFTRDCAGLFVSLMNTELFTKD